MADDLAVFGHHDAAARYKSRPIEPFQIWPQHAKTVDVFLACRWSILTGIAGIYYESLDRSSIKDSLELMCVERFQWPDIFNGLRIMELAAKPVLNKRN